MTNAEYYLYNDELVPGTGYTPDNPINYDEYPSLDLILAELRDTGDCASCPKDIVDDVKPVYYHSKPIKDPFDDAFLSDLQ